MAAISTPLYNFLSQYPELDLVPYSMASVGTDILPFGATQPNQTPINKNYIQYDFKTTTPKGEPKSQVDPAVASAQGTLDISATLANFLYPLQQKARTANAIGSVASAIATFGKAFTDLSLIGGNWKLAHQEARNTEMSVENRMLALDNQIAYNKNQITDRFGKTMARNAFTMAAKNLNVTAGNILEQTKDEAYDATQDIQTMISNAELNKISLRAEARQAEVKKKLSKNLLASNVIGSLANLGYSVSMGIGTGGFSDFGKLFTSGSGSLNATVYGSQQ